MLLNNHFHTNIHLFSNRYVFIKKKFQIGYEKEKYNTT